MALMAISPIPNKLLVIGQLRRAVKELKLVLYKEHTIIWKIMQSPNFSFKKHFTSYKGLYKIRNLGVYWFRDIWAIFLFSWMQFFVDKFKDRMVHCIDKYRRNKAEK